MRKLGISDEWIKANPEASEQWIKAHPDTSSRPRSRFEEMSRSELNQRHVYLRSLGIPEAWIEAHPELLARESMDWIDDIGILRDALSLPEALEIMGVRQKFVNHPREILRTGANILAGVKNRRATDLWTLLYWLDPKTAAGDFGYPGGTRY